MKDLNRILKKYFRLLFVAIFLIALTFRWWYLPQNAISFAYDQARDAFLVAEILHGHLKVLGPPVSGVPGLFHGVLYYYVIAPAYFIGHGNPTIVAYVMSFISSLTIFPVFYLTWLLTKKILPSLMSALIFAFSFEASQYANLLTNASMGVWFVPFIYIGLYLWITRSLNSWQRKWAPVIAGLGFGLSIQSEVALGYHFAPLIFWLLIFRKKITKHEIVLFIGTFLVAISSMIVSEIKFGFQGTTGILYLLTGQDKISNSRNFFDFIKTFFVQTGKTLSFTIFPLNILAGGIIGFIMIVYALIEKLKARNLLSWEIFLASYIFAHLVALPFGGSNMRHLMVGAAPGIAIFTGIFIWKYLNKKWLISLAILIFILGSNAHQILKENINGQTIFPLQPDLLLSKEIQVLDFTFEESHGKDFSISTLTSPLFVNTLWSYLYNWYGYEKYGYLPYWIGRDQVGQLGNNLPFAPGSIHRHFYIIEPTYGIPELWVTYAKGDQDAISNIVKERKFGELVVQERSIK
jgi:hypothetical protein